MTRPQLFARLGLAGLGIIAFGAVTSMLGSRPEGVAAASPLEPCPDSPNCYSTSVRLTGDADHVFQTATWAVRAQRSWRTGVWSAREPVTTHRRLAGTFRVGLFTDALTLAVTPMDKTTSLLHIRSASRTGRSDLGVNRIRVHQIIEQTRTALTSGAEPRASHD